MKHLTTEKDVMIITDFLSGSETSLFVYQYIGALNKGNDILKIADNYDDLSPIKVLANFFPQKLSSYLSKYFPDKFNNPSVKGFDCLYDSNKSSIEEIFGDSDSNYYAVIAMARSIQLIVDGEALMINPQEIAIFSCDQDSSLGKDNNESMSPILVAQIQ